MDATLVRIVESTKEYSQTLLRNGEIGWADAVTGMRAVMEDLIEHSPQHEAWIRSEFENWIASHVDLYGGKSGDSLA